MRKQYEGEWGERERACCLAHAVGAVEHAVVEVDVDELRTVLHLPKEKGVKKERGREKAVHAYSSPRVCNRVCVPRARESEEPSQATTVQSCGHRSHR